MSTTTREPALAAMCAVLLVGLASPTIGTVAGASLGETVNETATGDSLADADATIDTDAPTDESQSDDDGGVTVEATTGGTDATVTVDGTETAPTVDADGTPTGGGNGSASVDADDPLDADGSLDADATVAGNESAVTAETNVSASADGTTVDVDAEVDATVGTTELVANATLGSTEQGPLAGLAGSTLTAGDRAWADSDGLDGVPGDTATATGARAAADGEDTDGTSGDSREQVPAGVPVGAIGVAVVGSATAARAGATVGSVGSVPSGGLAPVRGAVDWLRAELPDPIFPFGYSRHDDSDPLEHDRRAAIYEAVASRPGVHLSGLEAATDAPLSSLRYHVRILEHEGLVETDRVRGRRRLFLAGTDNTALTAALDVPATAAVLQTLADAEPATVSDLADRLDRDPSTVSHHLSRLAEDGLVERERDGKAVRTSLAPVARRVVGGEDGTPAGTTAD